MGGLCRYCRHSLQPLPFCQTTRLHSAVIRRVNIKRAEGISDGASKMERELSRSETGSNDEIHDQTNTTQHIAFHDDNEGHSARILMYPEPE